MANTLPDNELDLGDIPPLPEEAPLGEDTLVLEDNPSLPEPPSLEELDLDLAQGKLGGDTQEDLAKEILLSEEMPAEEPELEDIEELLGPPPSLEEQSLPEESGIVEEKPIEQSFEEAMAGAPSKEEFFTGEQEEDLLFSDEELDLLSVPETPPAEDQEVPKLEETETQAGDFFEDSEEPVTLSAEEMEGILGDVAVEEQESEGIPVNSGDFFAEETEEPITLSSEEMDNILQDSAPELESPAEIGVEPPTTVQDELGEMAQEEEGEITLSQEELEGILEDAEIGEEAPTEPFSSLAEAGVSESQEDFFAATDEEPVTLSEEELGGIVEDAEPELAQEREQEVEEKGEEPFTITENLDKRDLEAKEGREERLLEKAEGKMPDREELRKMIAYLDNLLGELPDEVIIRFAQSEYYQLYQKVMESLDL
ncbi:MAG: hypothetical protein RML34_00800 [Leptospiraceae bacterium]|nr:hypothetical protein [Leptospiraceae bacterium]